MEAMKKGQGSADDKIRNRYMGVNDPIAKRIIEKMDNKQQRMVPPEDKTITTLFLGGITDEMTEQETPKEI